MILYKRNEGAPCGIRLSLVKARAGGIKTSWKPKALAMLLNNLNRRVRLSISRHNFIPHSRTTYFRFYRFCSLKASAHGKESTHRSPTLSHTPADTALLPIYLAIAGDEAVSVPGRRCCSQDTHRGHHRSAPQSHPSAIKDAHGTDYFHRFR